MTLLQVQPDTEYGQAHKNVAFLVDAEVLNQPVHVAMHHIMQAAKEPVQSAIAHFGKQKWEVDTSRKLRFFKSPLQMTGDDLPAIDTLTPAEMRPAKSVNDLLHRTGMIQMVARVYFKRVPLDLLPRPEELLGEKDGFVNREEVDAAVPDHHKTWKVKDDNGNAA